jgi:hypothetical protein
MEGYNKAQNFFINSKVIDSRDIFSLQFWIYFFVFAAIRVGGADEL